MNETSGFSTFAGFGAVENSASGIANTLIIFVLVNVKLQPAADVSVSEMEYTPAVLKQCEGFWLMESGLPSPKFQFQPVMLPLEITEASVKLTQSGAQPEVTSALKIGLGTGSTVMITWSVAGGVPQPSVTVTV